MSKAFQRNLRTQHPSQAPNEQTRQPILVKTFFDAVGDAAGAAKHLSDEAGKSILNDSTLPIPACVESLLAKFDSAHHSKILDGVRRGIEKYTEEHVDFIAGAVRSAVEKLSRVSVAV